MTYQKVNVTNYTHRDTRERTHSKITYGVGIYLYNSKVKNVMSGYKMSTCQLSGCCNKHILKLINVCIKTISIILG